MSRYLKEKVGNKKIVKTTKNWFNWFGGWNSKGEEKLNSFDSSLNAPQKGKELFIGKYNWQKQNERKRKEFNCKIQLDHQEKSPNNPACCGMVNTA